MRHIYKMTGIVFPAGNYSDSSYVAASFTIPDQSDSMLYLALSEYFFQMSPFAYYTAGAFNMIVAEEVEKCSAPYPLMLKLMSTEIPIISLQRDSFTVKTQGSVEVLAILPDSTTRFLFILKTADNTSIPLNIFDQKLMGSLCLNSDSSGFISLQFSSYPQPTPMLDLL
ncbi:BPI fold-containing family C protein, partial [Lonchura striata]